MDHGGYSRYTTVGGILTRGIPCLPGLILCHLTLPLDTHLGRRLFHLLSTLIQFGVYLTILSPAALHICSCCSFLSTDFLHSTYLSLLQAVCWACTHAFSGPALQPALCAVCTCVALSTSSPSLPSHCPHAFHTSYWKKRWKHPRDSLHDVLGMAGTDRHPTMPKLLLLAHCACLPNSWSWWWEGRRKENCPSPCLPTFLQFETLLPHPTPTPLLSGNWWCQTCPGGGGAPGWVSGVVVVDWSGDGGTGTHRTYLSLLTCLPISIS